MSSAALRGHIRMRIILGDLISPTASSTFAAAASCAPRADIQAHGTEESRPAHTLALFQGLSDAQLVMLPGTGHGGIDTRIGVDFLTAPWEVDR
jgi:hypothetical protein